jgi:hypothetical protein
MKLAKASIETIHHRVRGAPPAGPRDLRARSARHTIPALVAVTLCLALAGGFMAFQIISDGGGNRFTDGRVPTSFGAVWVDSFREISIPKTIQKGHVRIPQAGDPDKVALEVTVTLANTTTAPVELTPARFALRLEDDDQPISAEGATFESVRLLPGAMFLARIQFPVPGGEHRLGLLFDDPDGSGPVAIDLGRAAFQYQTGDDHTGQHR